MTIETILEMMQIHDFIEARSKPGDGDCVVWTGSVDSYGCPIMRKPGSRKLRQVRRIKLEEAGKRIDGLFATVKCDNPLCICDDHIIAMTRKQIQRRSSKQGKFARSPAQRQKMAEIRRAASKITPEIVDAIRVCGLTTKAAGKTYGISQSSAAQIMAYKSWKTYSGPFAGLMA